MATLKASPYIDIALGYSLVGLDANRSRSTVTRLEYLDHRLNTQAAVRDQPVAVGGPGGRRHGQRAAADAAARRRQRAGGQRGRAGRQVPDGAPRVPGRRRDRHRPRARSLLAAPPTRAAASTPSSPTTTRRESMGCMAAACSARGRRPTIRWRGSWPAEAGRPFYYYSITPRAEMLPSPAIASSSPASATRSGFHRLAARCVLDARDFLNVELTLRTLGETLLRLGERPRARQQRSHLQAGLGRRPYDGHDENGAERLDVGRGRRLPRARVRQPVCRRVVGLPERRRLREPDADHRRAGTAPGRPARRRGGERRDSSKTVATERGWA